MRFLVDRGVDMWYFMFIDDVSMNDMLQADMLRADMGAVCFLGGDFFKEGYC